MSARDWTPDRVETLARLWAEGASAAEIARRLGRGVSRSAVLGKVHRLGIAQRGCGRPPASAPPRPARPAPPRPARARGRALAAPAAPRRAPCPPEPAVPEPHPGRTSLLEVRTGECRWPIGDPLDAAFALCGAPATRGAYCAAHGARAYRPTARDALLRLAGLA